MTSTSTLTRNELSFAVPVQRRAVRPARPVPAPAAALRLTRRGRVTVLALAIVALFLTFSVGRVLSSAASGPAKPATHTIVVAPGDTAWSIAKAAMPGVDGRQAVDRLLAMNHSDGTIRSGQTLVVPGP